MLITIKDITNKRSTEIDIKEYFTIASIEQSDVYIPCKLNHNFLFNIKCHNNFIIAFNNGDSFSGYKTLELNTDNNSIILCIKNDNKFIFNFYFIQQEYKDISDIYNTSLFQKILKEIQNELIIDRNNFDFKNSNEILQKITKIAYKNSNIVLIEDFLSYDLSFFSKLIWCFFARICSYGILDLPLLDSSISEIMVNDFQTIYLESKGRIIKSDLKFNTESDLRQVIEKMASQSGRRIDESTPYCDGRLEDGSRIHAILPPLALNGSCLTIRKFMKYLLSPEELVSLGSISNEAKNILKEIVQEKKNILISGGTGSGKTTLLNCLSSFIPNHERIITIEDSAELQLQQNHVIRLESRTENSENIGLVSLRDLVKNALRMRPDRIIVGECRGAEALDMLQAMNTGHEGSMTTIHANTPLDALRRLETLVLFSEIDLPARAVREQINSSIHYIVQQTRDSNGRRFVKSIEEVLVIESDYYTFKTKIIYKDSSV